MTPYLLISDLHCHQWSAFASTGKNGVNTRLQAILDELMRAATEAETLGIKDIVIAGDLFHVRGSIDPEVFNPAHAAFLNLSKRGFSVYAIPGNHDLKGKDTTELGNAIQSLAAVKNFNVLTKPWASGAGSSQIAMIPWCSSYDELRKKQTHAANQLRSAGVDPEGYDLIIHAGINGVLAGLPDHGLEAAEVASWEWNRVFAGHYHNFKEMEKGRVVSIGATAHQQWGDLGTRSGFIIVRDGSIEHRASHAPSFIEVTGDTDEEEIPLLVDGNYVRIRGMKLTDAEIGKFRKEIEDMGALGVVFQVARETVSARSGTASAKGLTLDQSVARHIDDLGVSDASIIKTMCEDVLTSVRSVSV